jgi:hypothetical protein
MRLYDFFQYLRAAGVIPDAFGINNRNRPVLADTQAIGFRSIYPAGAVEVEFTQPPLKILPGFDADFFFTAFRFRLIGAQKNMALYFIKMALCRFLLQAHFGRYSIFAHDKFFYG